MILRRASPLSTFKVLIGEINDHGYDAQSVRRELRSGVSELSSRRGGRPRSPWADVTRLTGRDDVTPRPSMVRTVGLSRWTPPPT
ncbi:hypothetical protein BHE74_00053566 [Ensete ventricosum]|nr:hypothetical protein GW17_00007633 [Ensete ventricosum]RWW40980.1 hypothetical protein BHE74_00053566 [Ensete ventricosum]